jgi:heme/copper-type cytochrome/quinol oxidase subunit 2
VGGAGPSASQKLREKRHRFWFLCVRVCVCVCVCVFVCVCFIYSVVSIGARREDGAAVPLQLIIVS